MVYLKQLYRQRRRPRSHLAILLMMAIGFVPSLRADSDELSSSFIMSNQGQDENHPNENNNNNLFVPPKNSTNVNSTAIDADDNDNDNVNVKLQSSVHHDPTISYRKCDPVIKVSNNHDQDSQQQQQHLHGLICLSSWGDVHWICPLIEQFEGPPFLELESMAWQDYVDNISYGPCFYCPSSSSSSSSSSDCESAAESIAELHGLEESVSSLMKDRCREMCESGTEGDICSDEEVCTLSSHFCDYSNSSSSSSSSSNNNNNNNSESGVCQPCPATMDECYNSDWQLSSKGRTECTRCSAFCYDLGYSNFTVGQKQFQSDYIHFAIQDSFQYAVGPIVDCSNLVIPGGVDETPSSSFCKGGDAKGSICYVDDFTSQVLYWQLSNKAEAVGCKAIVFTAPYQDVWLGCGTHGFSDMEIPFVCIHPDDGKFIQDHLIGQSSTVEVEVTGQACLNYHEWGNPCTELVPCEKGEFCPFDKQVVHEEYVVGYCRACPIDENGDPDPLYCYFDTEGGNIRNAKLAKSCIESCDAQIESKSCKFCPDQLDPIQFGLDNGDEKCSFCPHHDISYPDRLVPLFGDNIACWQMQGFYENMDIPQGSQNCALAQSMNFICGCEGPGYAGANTETKQAMLVWLPRVMATLSAFGSLFIVYDSTKTIQKRRKLLNQMLSTLSVFDVLGSIAYAFTSLPTPEEDYIYGSRGNDATCKAQGFFIQMGTTACLLNVSLSVYYLISIKHGRKDDEMKAIRWWLFIPPITVGLAFAFAGVPFYDNMILWCNNSARYWPEAPVILSIIIATITMVDVCFHVYKKTRVTRRYSIQGNRLSLSVFRQACWFTGAFYITWVPYLALQYMWSSGKALTNYGFILYAATSVPLQGFWNFMVYIRPRYMKDSVDAITALPSRVTQRVSIVLPRRSNVSMNHDLEDSHNESDTSRTRRVSIASSTTSSMMPNQLTSG